MTAPAPVLVDAERAPARAALHPAPMTLRVVTGIQNGMAYSMEAYAGAIDAALRRWRIPHRAVTCRLPGRRRGSMTARVWTLAAWRYVIYPLRAMLDRGRGVRLVLDHANAHVGWVGGPGPRVVVVHDVFSMTPPETIGGSAGVIGRLRFLLSRAFKAPALRSATALVAVSEATRQRLIEVVGVDPVRVSVARPGVDTEVFRPGDRVAARRALGLDLDVPIVLNVAGLERRKREDLLIACVARLRAHGVPARLVCVGRRATTATRRALAAHGLGDVTRFVGEVGRDDLVRYYQAADVLAHPTSAEGSSLVALEAMAVGCPVVTSRLPALADLCGDAAVLVTPGDVDGFAAALQSVVSDPERARALRRAGAAVVTRAPWSQWAAAVLAACPNVIGVWEG